ncbi:MFS transporter [Herpetosiphon llansteffanensis]|uniref:MFS transporter n=1 Tax=Herpetosiphon llansteffanensis TaxID=2094568 RepID=UPI000D7BAFBF|nr:MFS transporter [Herpetosiphon llansteffanensis]
MQSNANGLRTFFWIWLGELISLLGSRLTSFALGVWVYQTTGSATSFALNLFFIMVPGIILAPFVGVWVDRWNIRTVMILSDSILALNTIVLLVLFLTKTMFIEFIYIFGLINSIGSMFQQLSSTVAFSLIIPKQHLSRSSGMIQFSESLTDILAPLLGGFLVLYLGIIGIIVLDLLTFGVAVITLMLINIPGREQTTAVARSIWRELGEGWQFIRSYAGLFGLLIFYSLNNLLLGIVDALTGPLALTLGSSADFGFVVSAGGWGLLFGSLLMSTWGGPQQRIHGVVGVRLIFALGFIAVGLYPTIWVLALANGLYYFGIAVATSSTQAIWQTKVSPKLQGRVLAFRRMLAQSSLPVAFLLAGPLAERLFEPGVQADGWISNLTNLSWSQTTGRGTGLVISLMGVLMLGLITLTYANPRVRRVESEVPDFRQASS